MKLGTYSLLIAFLLATSLLGQSAPKNQVAEEPALNESDSIREIIFKRILPNIQSPDNSYFFAVDGRKNPTDALLKRFVEYKNKYKVKIKKVSECIILASEGDAVFDTTTNKPGIIFEISELKWNSKDEVEANAGSYLGNMGSDSCKYKLKKENGDWKIVSAEKCYVS